MSIFAATLVTTGIAVGAAFLARRLGMSAPAAFCAALFVAAPFLLLTARWIVRKLDESLSRIDDGLRAFMERDFSMRLAASGNDRLSSVKRLYNAVADVLRTQRNDVYQRELLLHTILQRTPLAVVLVSAGGRVVYSNTAARELFAAGGRLDGHLFGEIVERLPAPVREAIGSGSNAIVSVRSGEQDETFHLVQRTFELNTVEHRLVLVERLTSELRRQEIAVWKNAIRVINHEMNNTIAPISSMIHSARIAQERPEHRHRLVEIYQTIEERLSYLRTFLESYAQFARLPEPRRERTSWSEILEDVRALYDFRIEGNPREEATIDRAQMQQVLINLVKNAHESGSDPSEVVVSIQRAVEGTVLRVLDRGRGMTEEVMRQALVPFYTTKPAGSGLGLPLCNEIVEAHHGRMHLQGREGGGTVVTCWLP